MAALFFVNCCGSPVVFFLSDVFREEVHVRVIRHGYPHVAPGDPPARVWRVDWPGDTDGIHYQWSNWTNDDVRVDVGGFQVDFPSRAPEAAYDPGCPPDECTSSVRIGGFLCARSVFGAYATGHTPCSLRVWESADGTRGCTFEIADGLAPDPRISNIPGISAAPTHEIQPEKCPADFRWDPGA